MASYRAGNDGVREGAVAPIRAALPASEADTEENLVFLCVQHQVELEAGRIEPETLREAKGELYRSLREGRVTGIGDVTGPSSQYERHVFALLSAELRQSFNGQVTIHEGGCFPGLTSTSPYV